MPIVTLNSSILSQNCIRACVAKLDELSRDDQQLHIIATEFVEDIDILLIAYFILFKRRYTAQFPEFTIRVELQKNTKPALRPDTQKPDFAEHNAAYTGFANKYRQATGREVNDEQGRTLRQYMAYADLQLDIKQPFVVTYGYYLNYGEEKGDTDDISIGNRGKAGWLRLSRRFIPILSITRGSYELFFTQRVDLKGFNSFARKIKYDANSDDLYQNCASDIVNEIFKKQDKSTKLMYLSRQAFFLVVSKANVLNFYLKPKDYHGPDLQAGALQGEAAVEFYRSVTPLLAEVSGKPMMFQYVYSILLSSAMVPGRLTSSNRDTFIQILNQLWRFAKELVYGIQELAKNILEHSKDANVEVNGIITGRIYDRTFYAGDENFSPYLQYLTGKQRLGEQFLDVNVADDGETGVMATLYRKTSAIATEQGPFQQMFQDDLQLIAEGKVTFRDFLDNSRGIILGQQIKRATAHLGLIALAQLINDNAGLLQASTWLSTLAKKNRSDAMVFGNGQGGQPSLIPFGTHYRMVLPISRSVNYQPRFYFEPQAAPTATPDYIQGIEALFNFENVLYDQNMSLIEQIGKDKVLTIPLQRNDNPAAEYWNLLPFSGLALFETIKNTNQFFCIDLENAEVDPGRLFRLTGNWELEFPGWPLLISGIRSETYFKLLSLNNGYLKNISGTRLPFWNANSLVVFYNYTVHQDRRFYFTDVLWGRTVNDFVVLNRLVSRTNYNALTTDLGESQEPSIGFIETSVLENLKPLRQSLAHFRIFKGEYVLLPFHLLLRANASGTLFESNAAFLLQNNFEVYRSDEAGDPSDNLQRHLSAIPGFRLPDTHFRIGSKVHVSTFYYAKRFFQNSFFSSPLAFLVAREITQQHLAGLMTDSDNEAGKKFIDDGITLIGYGKYSELLVGMVQMFLGKIIVERLADGAAFRDKKLSDRKKEDLLKSLRLNHDLVDEADEIVRIHTDKIHKNIILVIPISTTFSTSIKIEQEIKSAYPDNEICSPHISVIYVQDDKPDPKDRLASKFGIRDENFEKGTAEVNAFYSMAEKGTATKKWSKQRFLLHMPTQWYDNADCEHCFPKEDPTEERPLFVTDKSQTNPVLVFGLPKGRITAPRADSSTKNQFKLNQTVVKYGHYVRDGNHYLYYIYVEEFFNQNKEQIRQWLNGLKGHGEFAELDPETHQVVIIAPGHNTNTGFVTLVNEVLFYNSANIIHYEPSNDHIQNFQLFYSKEVDNKVTKLIFVDDIMTSGNSFTRTNYFVKHTRRGDRGFDAALVLLDRSGNFVHENIKRKLSGKPKKFFAFGSINLPSLKATDQDCPLCLEHKRYLELAKHSFLDRLRYHFLQQAEKIRPLEIQTLKIDHHNLQRDIQQARLQHTCVVAKRYLEETIDDDLKYTRRINAIHSIFEWFASDANGRSFRKDNGFYQWFGEVRDAYSPFYPKLTSTVPVGTDYVTGEETDAFLKVISQTPFDQYKPFRERVFTWLLTFLRSEAQRVKAEIESRETKDITPASLRRLKFLIRRCGTLNSNFLISKEMFDILEIVLGETGIKSLIDTTRKESDRLKKIVDKQPGKQIPIERQQLLQSDALLENLQDFPTFYAAQVKELVHTNEAKSIHLEDLIEKQSRLPTYPLFRQLLRIMHAENGVLIQRFLDFVRPVLPNNVEDTYYYSNSSIITALKDDSIQAHYRYSTLAGFLQKAGVTAPIQDTPLLSYLWLMNYLDKETHISSQTLHNKTELILRKMAEILFDQSDGAGAFLIVRYKRNQVDDHFVAYNFGSAGRMNDSRWDWDGFHYIRDFISGIKDANLGLVTVAELKRDAMGWVDEYSTNTENRVANLDPELLPSAYDKLLLMRLNDMTAGVSEKNQLIGYHTDLPLGIMGIYFNSKAEDGLHRYRKRYLLMLREALSAFIERHHESSEFRDWIDANNSSRVALLTGHGREVLLSLTQKDFSHSNKRPYKDIVYTMLIVQRFLIDEQDQVNMKIPREHIKKIFFNFLSPKGDLIGSNYFEEDLKLMGEELFDFPEIENTDPADVTASAPGVSFEFQRGLLDMICFELLINAKKNRWLFTQCQPFGGLAKNQIQIRAEQDGNWLTITITNTGPMVGVNGMENLKLDNPKPDSPSSGISLIKKLLDVFGLGTLTFREDEQTICEELTRFHAILHIEKWPKIET